jgi:hypothetical protein
LAQRRTFRRNGVITLKDLDSKHAARSKDLNIYSHEEQLLLAEALLQDGRGSGSIIFSVDVGEETTLK